MDTLPPPELTYDTPAPSPLPPIQGIKIQKGYSCPSCNYHTVRLLTMKRHWRTTHQPIPIPTTFPRAYIQTISNSKTSPSFPVSYTPGPTFVSLTDREIYRFLHRYQTPQDPGHVPRVSDDEVEESWTPVFIQLTGWLQVLDGQDWEGCRALIPTELDEDPFFEQSIHMVRDYLQHCHRSIRQMPYDTRLLFGAVTELIPLLQLYSTYFPLSQYILF